MPEISRFFGIVILMFPKEHEPPHLHARYGEYRASFDLQDGAQRGIFPARARRLVLEWLALHRAELLDNWLRIRAGLQPLPVEPLE